MIRQPNVFPNKPKAVRILKGPVFGIRPNFSKLDNRSAAEDLPSIPVTSSSPAGSALRLSR